MKWKQILISLIVVILVCGTVMADATNTNSVVIVESAQSRLQPQSGVIYKIAPNWIYKTDNPGPAAFATSTAWSLADEFVFRTALRDSLVLPSESAGKRKEDDCYVVAFGKKGGGKGIELIVDPKNETVWLSETK